MAYLIGIPLLMLLSILQSVIVNDMTFLDGRPDLIFLVVVSWGIIGRPREAMGWALIGGLFLDLLSGLPFGVTAINLIIVSFVVSFTEGRFWESHVLMPMGVTLLSSLLFHFLNLATIAMMGYPIDLSSFLLRMILPSTFLNLLLALPASQLIEALSRSLYPPEVRI
jgi:rod shape-determining protein MreD